VKDGYEWAASIDLKSFFDEIPHELILTQLSRLGLIISVSS
jgi:retron-type reverse transcriptase